jgi:hypothetical protein
MPDRLVELPDGDITPLLDHLEGAVFINVSPGVDADQVPLKSVTSIFGNRGPLVPLATWTPGEIGVQHGVGSRAAPWLADHGCPVPDEWYVAADNPKRGLVLKTYATPAAETLAWLVKASDLLCPFDAVFPWQAVVRTR